MSSHPEWIMQAPVISTGHITKELNEELGQYSRVNAPWGQEVVDIEGGWLLYVGANEATDVPEVLAPLFAWTASLGYEWLRLDQDGDVIAGLPTYNW